MRVTAIVQRVQGVSNRTLGETWYGVVIPNIYRFICYTQYILIPSVSDYIGGPSFDRRTFPAGIIGTPEFILRTLAENHDFTYRIPFETVANGRWILAL